MVGLLYCQTHKILWYSQCNVSSVISSLLTFWKNFCQCVGKVFVDLIYQYLISNILWPAFFWSSPQSTQFLLHLNLISILLHNPQEYQHDVETIQQASPCIPICKKLSWRVTMPFCYCNLDHYNHGSFVFLINFSIKGVDCFEVKLQRYIIHMWPILQHHCGIPGCLCL